MAGLWNDDMKRMTPPLNSKHDEQTWKKFWSLESQGNVISASSQVCASLLFRKRGKFPNHLFQVNLSEDHLLALWISKLTCWSPDKQHTHQPTNDTLGSRWLQGFRHDGFYQFINIMHDLLSNEPHHKRCMINKGMLKKKRGFVVSDVHPDRITKF